MLDKFKPDYEYTTTYDIDFSSWYDKGIRGAIFDIDNTLVAHDAPSNEQADKFIEELERIGIKPFLMSNNKEDRVKLFLKDRDIPYIYKADKPSIKSYDKALEMLGLEKNQVVAVGDQLLTDCMGARNAGITFLKVGILDKKEPPHIRFKRGVEKIIELFTK